MTDVLSYNFPSSFLYRLLLIAEYTQTRFAKFHVPILHYNERMFMEVDYNCITRTKRVICSMITIFKKLNIDNSLPYLSFLPIIQIINAFVQRKDHKKKPS